MKNQKLLITVFSIISVIVIVIGASYAYWLITKKQTEKNVFSTGCLDISLSGSNDIRLLDQYPIADEDGMELKPYTFTVTNNCNTSVDYQINLETVSPEDQTLTPSSIKVSLNDKTDLLNNKKEVSAVLEDAHTARMLEFSRLSASGAEGSSDSYELRLWVDENAPVSEQGKTFRSKITVSVGQHIKTKFEEGSLAYDILANYGGAGATEILDPEAVKVVGNGQIYLPPTTSVYFGTEAVYNKEKGEYTLSGELIKATSDECRNGTKKCGKYTLRNESATYSYNILYEITDLGKSGDYIWAKWYEYKPTFSVSSSESQNIYKTNDDLGDSYYFRGAPTNNYVKFGTYANDSAIEYQVFEDEYQGKLTYNINAGDPIYWRIVRINGDGTIRLAYDGPLKVVNGTSHPVSIGKSNFNISSGGTSANNFVSYTYEETNSSGELEQVDSAIKKSLDAWYTDNLDAKYGKYIADAIFCNDRTAVTTTPYTIYAAQDRIKNNFKPQLVCTNKEDRYSLNTDIGNGLLSKPIGLLTADEVNFAGASIASVSTTFYLYYEGSYWTSSPSDNNNEASIYVIMAGSINPAKYSSTEHLGYDIEVRPVINLKPDVKFTGDGSFATPYEIVID